jgi:Trp operon repressor
MVEQMSEKDFQELIELVANINDKEAAKGFIVGLLTPAELDDVKQRLQIFKKLVEGMPQREIAETLDVSIGTVSRASRELKYGASDIGTLIKTIL